MSASPASYAISASRSLCAQQMVRTWFAVPVKPTYPLPGFDSQEHNEHDRGDAQDEYRGFTAGHGSSKRPLSVRGSDVYGLHNGQ